MKDSQYFSLDFFSLFVKIEFRVCIFWKKIVKFSQFGRCMIMKLSQIFESLSPASVIRTEITNDAIRIRQVCKLSMASSSFADDTLYISLLSNYTALRCYGSDSLFLLIKDQEDLSQVIWPSNYILCTSDIAEADLYVRLIKLQSTSNRVTDAKITLSHALFDCTSITELLEIASHLLGNPILLQDFTTRMLAHSSLDTMRVDDEILNSVFQLGYVTADLFKKYDYDSVLEMIRRTPQTFLLASTKKSSRLICRLMIRHQYFGWFLAAAYNQSFQDGDIEIMDFLAGALTVLLEKENILPNTSHAESLLAELMEPDHAYTEELFRERAAGFGWKLTHHFRIAVIDEIRTQEESCQAIMAYKNHLSLMFPDARILERNHQLILLFDRKKFAPAARQLMPFLQKYRLHATISNEFDQILEYPHRYKQTRSILSLGKKLHPEDSIHYFDRYAMYYAILQLAAADNIRDYCMPQLIAVYRYDREYHTEFALSRRLTLELGSATAAAQHLNIHRNTMDYRLKKFNEIAGISRETPDTAEHLMLSYKILDLFPEIL